APVAPASAAVYVQIPPPPVQFEVQGAPPSRAHVWIGGYHRWDGREYGWVPGHWQRPPRPYATWVPGHWRQRADGWYWVPGDWRGRSGTASIACHRAHSRMTGPRPGASLPPKYQGCPYD